MMLLSIVLSPLALATAMGPYPVVDIIDELPVGQALMVLSTSTSRV
jgi:hypothetical protein